MSTVILLKKSTLALLLMLVIQLSFAQQKSPFNPLLQKIAKPGSTMRWVYLIDSLKIDPKTFFIENKNAFSLTESDEIKLTDTFQDSYGNTYFNYQQYHNGYIVVGGEYRLKVRGGNSEYFFGGLMINNRSQEDFSLSESDALEFALQTVKSQKYYWLNPKAENEIKQRTNDQNASYFPKGRLVYMYSNEIDESDDAYYLCWHFDINVFDIKESKTVFVEASSGEIINVIPLFSSCFPGTGETIHYGPKKIYADFDFNSNSYILKDCSNLVHTRNANGDPSGSQWSNYKDADNIWTSTPINVLEQYISETHWGVMQTINYYNTKFPGNNYFNSGTKINYCNPGFDDNAGWSTTIQAVLFGGTSTGQNAIVTVDICGHEWTHAFIEDCPANLAGTATESGALAESFGDIFGEMVQLYALKKNDWIVSGENSVISNYLKRSLKEPKTYDCPDTYKGEYWDFGSDVSNYVHTNCGVQDFWFYLLCEGGSNTNDNNQSYTVKPIGVDAAIQIVYQTLTTHLNSNSNYEDAMIGSIASAKDIFGNTCDEVQAVRAAWYAVGLNPLYITEFSPATASKDDEVEIHGSNFNNATIVKFGEIEAAFTINSDNLITAIVPEGAITGPIRVGMPSDTARTCTDITIVPPCNTLVNSGGKGISNIEQGLGAKPGHVIVTYDMHQVPDQMDLIYNNVLVETTGGLISGPGTLHFIYDPPEGGPYSCFVNISAPEFGTLWEYEAMCPVPVLINSVSKISSGNKLLKENQFSAGDTINIHYKVLGTEVENGNTFTAELTLDYGSNSYPVTLATLQSEEEEGDIIAVIPKGIVCGNYYRITVFSDKPDITADNGEDIVIENPNPLISINQLNDMAASCKNDLLSFTTEYLYGSNSTYQWQKNGENIPDATDFTYSNSDFDNNDELTCKVTLSTVCGDTTIFSNAISLIVNENPVAEVFPAGGVDLCQGESQLLSANDENGLTYQWMVGSTPISNETGSSYNATVLGSYRVVVTNEFGCDDTSEYTGINVHPLPPAFMTPTGINDVCAGEKLTLTANSDPGSSFTWIRDGAIIQGATKKKYQAKEPGVYQVRREDYYQCSNISAPTTVNQLEVPLSTIDPSGSVSICKAASITLKANEGSGFTYKWIKDGNVIEDATSIAYSASKAAKYKVEITNSQGCKNESEITTVKVEDNPVSNIDPAGPIDICEGENVTLTASSGNGNIYQWVKDEILIVGATSKTFKAFESGNYKVNITNSTGCSKMSKVTKVTANLLPLAIITPSGTVSICNGKTTTLIATQENGLTYQWIKDDNPLVGQTNSTFVADGSLIGKISVEITNTSNCSAISEPTTIKVLNDPEANITILNNGNLDLCFGEVKLRGTSGSSLLYQWYKTGVIIAGATNKDFFPLLSGIYQVEITSDNGCSKKSDPVTVLQTCKILEVDSNAKALRLYPNPTQGTFNIDLNVTPEFNAPASIMMYNILGQISLFEIVLIKEGRLHKEIANKILTPGLYLIKIVANEMIFQAEIIIE